MSGQDGGRSDAVLWPASPSSFRTIGATTAWTPEQAELVLDFLEQLRADLWACYGEEVRRLHYDEDGGGDAQCQLDLDEPPF